MAKANAALVLVLSLLTPAAALRVQSASTVAPSTAVCVVGDARTLPKVQGDLHQFVGRLPGSGLVRQGHPDVFAYVTLEGAPPKGQEGWDFPAVNVSREEAEGALRPLQPARSVLVDSSNEVTEENIDKYVKGRTQCFSVGYYNRTPGALRRSVNQLTHWQRCLDLIVEQELAMNQRYSVVVIARPDMGYNMSTTLDLEAVAEKGYFLNQRDLVMVMPRLAADQLLRQVARPLTCHLHWKCCSKGRMDSSEKIWEYLLGIYSDDRERCNCGPSAAQSGITRQFLDQPIGWIVRP